MFSTCISNLVSGILYTTFSPGINQRSQLHETRCMVHAVHGKHTVYGMYTVPRKDTVHGKHTVHGMDTVHGKRTVHGMDKVHEKDTVHGK